MVFQFMIKIFLKLIHQYLYKNYIRQARLVDFESFIPANFHALYKYSKSIYITLIIALAI